MVQRADGWRATALDVHHRLHGAREESATAALATVVDVEGVAFRRPGAKMVLTPEGDQVGAVTAGCLEDPVRQIAEEVFDDGLPRLRRFDLMDDDDGWGLGLGCNGVIDVFVEPVDASLDGVLDALDDGRPAALATVVDVENADDEEREAEDSDVPVGARAALLEGDLVPVDGRPSLPADVRDDLEALATDCAEHGRTAIETVERGDESLTVFVDGLEPPPELLVFGGQPDTIPVTDLARQAGFRVTVATARGGLADAGRYPAADAVRTVKADAIGDLVDDRTYVVIMTHNLVDDELALASLAETEVPYVGLMGPRERFEQIRADLEADDVVLPDDFLDRIATPVGLDLGGGAPMEIALSIVAEVQAVRHDRDGGRLCDREGPIHAADDHVSGDHGDDRAAGE